MTPGDRITVTIPRSPSREGEYVEDRGTRCRVLLDGEHVTRIVLRERVKPDRSAAFVASVAVARADGVSSAAVVEVADAALASGTITPSAYLTALRAVPKPPKPARDARYLAYVREYVCCACGAKTPSEAHHFGPRGMSQKCSDYYAVPLCTACHRHFHDKGVVPGRSREDTESLFAVTQADALCAWVQTPESIVEAMISHITRESQT